MAQTLVKHSGIANYIVGFSTRISIPILDETKRRKLCAATRSRRSPGSQPRRGPASSGVTSISSARSCGRTISTRPGLTAKPPIISFKLDTQARRGTSRSPGRSPKSSSMRPMSRACICAAARWRAAASDGRTGRRISVPRCLGLAKAQGVKNAVIVPVGAKGGFVPKRMPPGAAATRSRPRGYGSTSASCRAFSTSPTISRTAGWCRPRAPSGGQGRSLSGGRRRQGYGDLLRHRQRNSAEHGFWLDDAFASGGSAGYDHKKMAITARGGGKRCKRHFREIDIDIQSHPLQRSSASATCRAMCSATACCCRGR